MRLSYGEWVVIGLSVIMAGVTWMMGDALNPAGVLISLVVSLLVFYLSFRIIRRYYPKSANWGLVQWTITIFLLGIVILVIAAIIIGVFVTLLFGGMIMSFVKLPFQEGNGATAPPADQPTATPLPTYARYGITFQYPEGKSLQEVSASDTSGQLRIGPPEDQMSITWVRSDTEPPDLDATMTSSLGTIATTPGVAGFSQGEMEKGTHLGHTATYVPVSYTRSGVPFHGGMIWWYCPESQRVFAIGIDTIFSPEYAKSTLQTMVRSFTCHT